MLLLTFSRFFYFYFFFNPQSPHTHLLSTTRQTSQCPPPREEPPSQSDQPNQSDHLNQPNQPLPTPTQQLAALSKRVTLTSRLSLSIEHSLKSTIHSRKIPHRRRARQVHRRGNQPGRVDAAMLDRRVRPFLSAHHAGPGEFPRVLEGVPGTYAARRDRLLGFTAISRRRAVVLGFRGSLKAKRAAGLSDGRILLRAGQGASRGFSKDALSDSASGKLCPGDHFCYLFWTNVLATFFKLERRRHGSPIRVMSYDVHVLASRPPSFILVLDNALKPRLAV